MLKKIIALISCQENDFNNLISYVNNYVDGYWINGNTAELDFLSFKEKQKNIDLIKNIKSNLPKKDIYVCINDNSLDNMLELAENSKKIGKLVIKTATLKNIEETISYLTSNINSEFFIYSLGKITPSLFRKLLKNEKIIGAKFRKNFQIFLGDERAIVSNMFYIDGVVSGLLNIFPYIFKLIEKEKPSLTRIHILFSYISNKVISSGNIPAFIKEFLRQEGIIKNNFYYGKKIDNLEGKVRLARTDFYNAINELI